MKINLEFDLDIGKDFEENSPYQEGIISEIYQRLDKSQLIEPPELAHLINTDNLVQKYLPEQTDIDKSLKIIQGHTSPSNNKRNTSGILKQSIFQRQILLLSSK